MKLWKVWGIMEKPVGVLYRQVIGDYVEGDTAKDVLATCEKYDIQIIKMKRTYCSVYTRKQGRIGGPQ